MAIRIGWGPKLPSGEMSKTDILTSIELAKGLDIVSGLDLRFESRRARRRARLHLALMLGTAAAAVVNFHPDLQALSVWAGIALSSLLLARSLSTVRTALRKSQVTKDAAKQIQSLLLNDVHDNQAFAYKISTFQPKMKLQVATVSRDNRLCVRTYSVAPGQEALLTIEERQVYVKVWLSKTFAQRWIRLAADRRISVPRTRTSQVRFEPSGTSPAE